MDVAESLVLTEDDYFDFLISVSEDLDKIPKRIQRVLTQTSLLFLRLSRLRLGFSCTAQDRE